MSQPMIDKIVRMLGDERVERRCAAAIVLAELRVKSTPAITALREALSEPNPTLQRCALEALAAAKAKNLAAWVSPLVDSPDDEVRTRACALLATQSSKNLGALLSQLEQTPVARQRETISIVAKNHDQATFERLVALLGNPGCGDIVLHTLRGEINQLGTAETTTLRELLLRRIKDKRAVGEIAGLARAVRLLGYFRDAKLVPSLVPYIGRSHPIPVRLAALAALRRPLHRARSTRTAFSALLECADDADATIARAAVDTLRELPTPRENQPALVALTSSRHSEARRFAIEALAKCDNPTAIRVLMQHVGGEDPATREAAGRGLAAMEGATRTLLGELSGALDDPPRMNQLCRLLKPHAPSLKPAARKMLAELAVDALERSVPTADPLLALVRAADVGAYGELLGAKALQHKRAKRHDRAFSLLCRLDQAGLLEDETRYAALVSGLCTVSSKKDLGRATRTTSPVLRQAVELLESGYPVARKLKRDKGVTAEDIFFVGFNFSESRDEDEREFGGSLLAHLASVSPRSKLGRSAKNKLRLVGLEH